MLKVPGLDTPAALARTGAVPITDLARTYDSKQPIVIINARTGRRQLIWAELDSNADSPANTALLIHPGKNFREGERYIVALRRLRGAAGELLECRSRSASTATGPRRRIRPSSAAARTWRTSSAAQAGGDQAKNLYLAWDFTVASERSLSARVLSIRDRAFAELGDRDLSDLKVEGAPPKYTIDRIIDYRGPAAERRRRIEGHVTVPCYLDELAARPGRASASGPTGSRSASRATPTRPRSSATSRARPRRRTRRGRRCTATGCSATPARWGDNVEQLGNENNVIVCAADWIGMSEDDLPNALGVLRDLSEFPTLPDRLQQGFLNFLYIGRDLIHAKGFASSLAFWDQGGPLIDTRRLFYYGNSQGGIAGGR